MATNYPSSLDTGTQQPSPSSTTDLDASGYEHDVVHTNHSGAIIALETKLGTTDSNAVEGAVLMGTGSGTSAWDTTPTIKGAVQIHADQDITDFTDDTRGNLTLYNSDGAVDDFTCLDFDGNSTDPAARIGMKYTSGGSELHFGTSNSYAAGITHDGLIIGPTGKVAIGDTSAMRNLDVVNDIMIHHHDDDHAWLWSVDTSGNCEWWYQSTYSSGDSGWSQKINIDGDGSTDFHVQGGSGTGYTHASVKITADGNSRGAGTYGFNAYSDRTWYWGIPYGNSDLFQVGRATGASLNNAAADISTSHQLFAIDSSGNAYNKTGSWGTISDERLKTNVADARSYLTDLNRLRVVTYQLNKQMVFDEGTITYEPLDEASEKMLGLVAQEVEQVFPSMVVENAGVKTVKTSVLVPMLLKAIQELTTRVAALEG